MSEEQKTTNLQALKNPARDTPDQKIDMFSLKGFELACRIGKAFAASDAVPMIFRSHHQKKQGNGDIVWIENTAAIGNCVVAIETAQAVGMSITAVMQNANVIEGRLTWSGKFIIAAINASRRFTPLRFQLTNKGMVTAKYREKQGWNKDKKGFDFLDKTVEIENLECIAWALPYGMQFPAGVNTLAQANAAGLPVIEGAPVSMSLAVEEGWYAKPGSKWQTGMKYLMLQYRAGSFFGNIHAPDVVMGMGRTTEEAQDMVLDFEPQPDGSHAVSLEALRAASAEQVATGPAAGSATVRDNSQAEDVDMETGEVTGTSDQKNNPESGAEPQAKAGTAAGPTSEVSSSVSPAAGTGTAAAPTFAQVADVMAKATALDVLAIAAEMISQIADPVQQDELRGIHKDHIKRLAPTAAGRRRAAPAADTSME